MNSSGNALLSRAHALYAKRLTDDDYNAMVNLSSNNELYNYLKSNTSYGDQIGYVPNGHYSRTRLERAVRKAQFERISSLCRFEKLIGEKVYNFYIRKSEVETIIFCTRHFQNDRIHAIENLPDFFKKEQCFQWAELENVKTMSELSHALKDTPYRKIIKPLANSTVPWTRAILENSLYTYLFSETHKNVEKSCKGTERDEIENHFNMLSDMIMIENLSRLADNYIDTDSYKANIYVSPFSNFTENEIHKMTESTSSNEIMNVILSSYYKKYFNENDFSPIEHKTRKATAKICAYNLRYSQNPILCMLSYCTLNENEIKNITHIIEGIRYKLSPPEILELIVKGENVWQ